MVVLREFLTVLSAHRKWDFFFRSNPSGVRYKFLFVTSIFRNYSQVQKYRRLYVECKRYMSKDKLVSLMTFQLFQPRVYKLFLTSYF